MSRRTYWRKGITCRDIRKEYGKLREVGERCGKSLLYDGFLSEAFIGELREFNERKKKLKGKMREFRLKWEWMEHLPTVKIERQCDSAEEYLEKFEDGGYSCKFSALGSMSTRETTKRNLTLVRLTPKDLGIKKESTPHEICAAAKKRGLELCPLWVAPQYLLDNGDVRTTFIGTKPIPVISGNRKEFKILYIFLLGLRVGSMSKMIDHSLSDSEWIFVVRK